MIRVPYRHFSIAGGKLSMPIYEYACKRCGNFEISQRISEEPLKKCPTCGSKVSKLISLSAFHLKGSGWYMTDYSKNGSSKDSKTDDTKPTTSAAKDSGTAGASTTSSSSAKETTSTSKESTATT
jgi:putative FmdB family regulatory protein